MRLRWIFLSAVAVLGLVMWGSDSISLQSERTVYTVKCANGDWSAHRCTGKFTAGDRYRYRALKAHGEVFFWIAGSQEPSGKLARCAIEDGRNWECPAANTDAAMSVTLAMSRGKAIRNATWPTRPLHPVTKLTWMLLYLGLEFTQSEDSD